MDKINFFDAVAYDESMTDAAKIEFLKECNQEYVARTYELFETLDEQTKVALMHDAAMLNFALLERYRGKVFSAKIVEESETVT